MITALGKLVFTTWKIIQVGTALNTPQACIRAIKKLGMLVGENMSSAWEIYKYRMACKSESLELVIASPANFDFDSWNSSSTGEFFELAIEQGLSLCSMEIALQLRVQYTDQPKGEHLIIAMEGLETKHDDWPVFHVYHDQDGRQINLYSGESTVQRNDLYVFLRRK